MEPTFETSRKASRDEVLAAFRLIAGDKDVDLVDAKAGRTILQYASAWRVYSGWCESQGVMPMPAPPIQLRDYLRYLTKAGRSPATVDSYLAAITTVHRYHGHCVDRTILVEPLKAARRRARALTGKELKRGRGTPTTRRWVGTSGAQRGGTAPVLGRWGSEMQHESQSQVYTDAQAWRAIG